MEEVKEVRYRPFQILSILYSCILMFNQMLIKHFFVSSECYSEKPESFRSCIYRNCCSWSRGNRYVQKGKSFFAGLIINSVWCLKKCPWLLLRKVFWHLTASFLFLYRRGTFAQGCERHNNQYSGDWGYCFTILLTFHYHPVRCLLKSWWVPCRICIDVLARLYYEHDSFCSRT